jgi:hypothetical protein
VPKVPSISDFWEKSDFSNRAQGAHQEIRFLGKIFGKNRISFEMEWSGNFRFRVLECWDIFSAVIELSRISI